ncbi:ABC transporter permease [Paenibacillus sp. J5C_2022]|uniref:ABC transporter permease n=1 Tax=Paenibacillus sp. J5C2022 TaxID=2977129 RepID=UPI0021CF0005|nr:ABC transporter permease [Paenibacillus sp. J5C2022]MCU6712614.1 ABC transporter permease [Paenibacillus sp. J5C2022]
MFWTIARKELLLILKDKGAFFWLIGLPILFIVMFSSIFGSTENMTINVNYYDADGSRQSGEFIGILEGIDSVELKQDKEAPLEDQLQQVRDGGRTLLVVIPDGFGAKLDARDNAEIEVYRDAAANDAAAPVVAILDSVLSQYREGKLQAVLTEMGLGEGDVKGILERPVTLTEVKEHAAKVDSVTQIVPGYTVMFVFFVMISMVTSFLKDRNGGMLMRLQGTPMKPMSYLIGMWIPHIIVVLIQSTTLLTFGHFVYGLSIGDPLAIALIVFGLAICATGLGLLLSLTVSSENMGIALVQIIAMGGAIMGGLWFPFEFLPRAVQIIGQFTPQYWAQQAMQDVMIRGAGVGGIGITLAVLFGFGLLGLAIALMRFRKFAERTV